MWHFYTLQSTPNLYLVCISQVLLFHHGIEHHQGIEALPLDRAFDPAPIVLHRPTNWTLVHGTPNLLPLLLAVLEKLYLSAPEVGKWCTTVSPFE